MPTSSSLPTYWPHLLCILLLVYPYFSSQSSSTPTTTYTDLLLTFLLSTLGTHYALHSLETRILRLEQQQRSSSSSTTNDTDTDLEAHLHKQLDLHSRALATLESRTAEIWRACDEVRHEVRRMTRDRAESEDDEDDEEDDDVDDEEDDDVDDEDDDHVDDENEVEEQAEEEEERKRPSLRDLWYLACWTLLVLPIIRSLSFGLRSPTPEPPPPANPDFDLTVLPVALPFMSRIAYAMPGQMQEWASTLPLAQRAQATKRTIVQADRDNAEAVAQAMESLRFLGRCRRDQRAEEVLEGLGKEGAGGDPDEWAWVSCLVAELSLLWDGGSASRGNTLLQMPDFGGPVEKACDTLASDGRLRQSELWLMLEEIQESAVTEQKRVMEAVAGIVTAEAARVEREVIQPAIDAEWALAAKSKRNRVLQRLSGLSRPGDWIRVPWSTSDDDMGRGRNEKLYIKRPDVILGTPVPNNRQTRALDQLATEYTTAQIIAMHASSLQGVLVSLQQTCDQIADRRDFIVHPAEPAQVAEPAYSFPALLGRGVRWLQALPHPFELFSPTSPPPPDWEVDRFAFRGLRRADEHNHQGKRYGWHKFFDQAVRNSTCHFLLARTPASASSATTESGDVEGAVQHAVWSYFGHGPVLRWMMVMADFYKPSPWDQGVALNLGVTPAILETRVCVAEARRMGMGQ
ncbi:hypothetical protein Tdes44962_MAKER08972 [Teratosphaeria destructans]|uniref:Uncharacterized protein n=1 Tax=Teratosphaeria destructans TaxID=418781 RepID=A0A9W7W3J0_9PEZI|nr:hypothetical protein Tdes44962_MAKER08972 [Teratosphaeria destructans]